jgi:hypothetical protein
MSYAPAATLKLHFGQFQIPHATRINFNEPQEGQRLFCFRVRYTLLYLFLTVAPNFVPRPFSTV